MFWLRLIYARLYGLLRKNRIEQEMDDEMRFHLLMRTRENIERGMRPEEAEREARRRFGNVGHIKDLARDIKGGGFMETLLQDLRYGARMLLKSPAFTLIAVVTLALGIGANTAIFSVVYATLLKPLPYEQPGQLVQLWEAPGAGHRGAVSPGAFLDWKQQSTCFESLSLLNGANLNLTGEGEPERISGAMMSASGLQILRARPLLGRTFAPDEDQPGKDKVVVLTDRLWQRRFAGNTNIVGRAIRLSDQSYTVIGVLPPGFLPWEDFEFVIPAAVAPKDSNNRSAHWLSVFGRMKSGLTIEQARAEMNALSARLKPIYPAPKQNWVFNVVSLKEQLTDDIKPALLVLLGAVGCVLLIACANVANLFLTRALARQREMAIRTALGAGRWRVFRQLMTESVLLALIGAVFGLLLAFWGVGALKYLTAVDLPRTQEIGIDLRVLGFALGISLLSGLAFGLAPAFQAAKIDLNQTFKEGGAGSQGRVRKRIRGSMIVTEVALALILLVGAGLLLNSFIRLTNVPPGINPENTLTMQISLPEKKYPDGKQRAAFFDQVVERIERLPGVEAAGVIGTIPLAGWSPSSSFSIIGRPGQPAEGHMVDFDFCTPNYFRTVGVPLLRGRFFDERDSAGSARVVLINDSLAREYFPNENPLGKRIHMEVFTGKLDEGWEIVGVVGDVRQRGQAENFRPAVYRLPAFNFIYDGDDHLVVRTTGAPLAMAESVRKVILEIAPAQPVANIRTMEDVVGKSVAEPRFIMMLLGGFAGTSLLLAAIGLYGVIAYGVSQRAREIGIRIALGAQVRDVLQLVIGHGMKLVLIGVGIGLIGALVLTRLIKTLLFGVTETDPLTFAVIVLLLTSVGLLACYLPAKRATKIDPLVALRRD